MKAIKKLSFTLFLFFNILIINAQQTKDTLWDIDYNMNLNSLSLQNLRIMRNAIFAKKGYLFKQADLRGYFSAYTEWYDKLSYAKWDEEERTGQPIPLTFTEEENNFIAKIRELEKAKKEQTYVDVNNQKLANVENIVNLFQYTDITDEFMDKLKINNFVIVPNDNIQFFHVYDKNYYNMVPNFVTTDMYLQLLRMYFSYTLKSLETEKFIPILTKLTEGLYNEAFKLSKKTASAEVKAEAEFSMVYFAIPYTILTGEYKRVSATYQSIYKQEINNFNAVAYSYSPLLQTAVNYDLFKPRGYYTRTDSLQRYFKAMMWIQTAPLCMDDVQQLRHATFAAWLLSNAKDRQDDSYLTLYKSIYDAIVFLIGTPDNLSVADIIDVIAQQNILDAPTLLGSDKLKLISDELLKISQSRNRINTETDKKSTCPHKINLMPQRYLLDNEIMQELVDLKPDAKRAYPKGLDIFGVLGISQAENILFNYNKEHLNWNQYAKKFSDLKAKFTDYKEWNTSVYNKWIESLVVMQQKDTLQPVFMQTEAWEKKNLNTALASWAELKHDAILYGEQPNGAEGGMDGPPLPTVLGYVEPNINFWQKMLDLLTMTKDLLIKNELMTEDLNFKNFELQKQATFMLKISKKEINKETLSEEEYRKIHGIGAAFEYLTLSLIPNNKSHYQFWRDISGPDKSVSVIADIYTRGIDGCSKNGVLHVAPGKVFDIYVINEIEGNLFLTKGSTFSYYEFVEQQRLTDESWQEKLDKGKAPVLQDWQNEIIIPSTNKIGVNERIKWQGL